jgi:hypothetical protein
LIGVPDEPPDRTLDTVQHERGKALATTGIGLLKRREVFGSFANVYDRMRVAVPEQVI